MTVVFHDKKPGHVPTWTIERTIRHIEGNLYETEVKEITPAFPEGRIKCGAAQRFTLSGGVACWASNDRILMPDVVREHGIDQLPNFVKGVHEAAYGAHLTHALEEYRKVQEKNPPSEEERHEMRAAFGPGRTVVNILTGRRTRT